MAARETLPPQIIKTNNALAKAWELEKETILFGVDAWSICIATCNSSVLSVDRIISACPKKIKAQKISGECVNIPEKVVVADLHGLKGVEFKHVIVLACGEDQFPAKGVHNDEKWRDALRLYVTMTRARDQGHLIHDSKNHSEFITAMGDAVDFQLEDADFKPPPQRDKFMFCIITLGNYYRKVTDHLNHGCLKKQAKTLQTSR